MSRPHLVFTKHTNSYTVYIKNLEQLTVPEIQRLESFVDARNGLFDFSTYKFTINKKLEFNDFVFLLRSINLDAYYEENIVEKTSQPRVGFGQYKGMQYSDLTDSYMLWLKANYRGYERELVDAELKIRNL
jgi:hypothetical protein